jgi:DNA gyrase/topoisomerase IV subunit B
MVLPFTNNILQRDGGTITAAGFSRGIDAQHQQLCAVQRHAKAKRSVYGCTPAKA